jgi:hypothetical protein
MIRVKYQRQLVQGELIDIECDLETAEDWIETMAPLLSEIDARMARQGRHVFAANQALGRLSPEQFQLFENIYAGLQGRRLGPGIEAAEEAV